MYAISLLVGVFIVSSEVRRKELELKFEDILDFVLIVFLFGLAGARLYFVFFNWNFYAANPFAIVGMGNGSSGFGMSGLAIHGGLIGGLIGLLLFVRWKNVRFWQFADSVAPAIIMGQALGRFGNFMNGDAFGTPTGLPWGIEFPRGTPAGNIYPNTPLHPTMLYELVINLSIFFLLWRLRKKDYRDGFIASLYFILYSVGRSVVSVFRGGSLWLGPLRASHVASIILIALFSYFLVSRKLYLKKST